MREAPRRTVLVVGDAATADAVRTISVAANYEVRWIATVGEMQRLPATPPDDVFVVVLDATKEVAIDAIECGPYRSWRLHGSVSLILVSEDRFYPPSVVETPEGEDFPVWSASLVKPISLLELRSELDDIFMAEDCHADHPLTREEAAERDKPIDVMAMMHEHLAKRQRREETRRKLQGEDGARIFMTALRLGVEFDEVDTMVDPERARRMLAMIDRDENPISLLGDEMSAPIFALKREGLLRRLQWLEHDEPDFEMPDAAEVATWTDEFLRAFLTRHERNHGITVDGQPPKPDADGGQKRRQS